MLGRDIYIPPGKIGYWQVAYRDNQDTEYDPVLQAIGRGEFFADVLYGDYEGGQRVITRFGVMREEDGRWQLIAARHWQIDRVDPR